MGVEPTYILGAKSLSLILKVSLWYSVNMAEQIETSCNAWEIKSMKADIIRTIIGLTFSRSTKSISAILIFKELNATIVSF